MRMQSILMPISEHQVMQSIKEKEVLTGRRGQVFITQQNGISRRSKLTVDGGMLIVDGKQILDASQVQILPVH